MDAIYLLIPLTLVLLAIAIGIFFWAVNTDQYSDLDKEASRILFEEKGFEEKGSEENQPEESNEKETNSEQSSRTSQDQSGQKQ